MSTTETKVRHSPLPWEVKEVMGKPFVATAAYEGHPYHGHTRFVDIIGDEDYPRKRADCELIVQAVNSHADMLEALEDALDSVRAAYLASRNPRQRDMFKLAVAKGEAAIAKARGGQQ